MRESLKKIIENSLFVHYPLSEEGEFSMEALNRGKPVEKQVSLWDGKDTSRWSFDGDGECDFSSSGTLSLHTWSRSEHWPSYEARAVDAANGFYATFGSYIPRLDVRGLDLAQFNRIRFKVKPVCQGLHSPIVRVGFTNNGVIKVPDQYSREGFNAMSLKNGEWNDCIWEIDKIAHDKVEEISFNFHRYGKEVSTGDDLFFYLKDIVMEKTEPNVVHGWLCKPETAVYSTTGYDINGCKSAVANTVETRFRIVSEKGECVLSGEIEKIENEHGAFSYLDFSSIETEGNYRIEFGTYKSEYFEIGKGVFESTIWKLLNFLYCERCGYPVPEKHGACHFDLLAKHNGIAKVFNGGWHDAADVSQQTVQTAEILDGVISVAEAVKESDNLLYLRLKEEANWALDFILRMSFEDGYNATNSAIRRWTDGEIGNMDDAEADVRYSSFDNFILSAVKAHSALFFSASDPELAWKCGDSARRDFEFATKRFETVGVEAPHMQEHTSNASLSQYHAAALLSASRLFCLTGEEYYQNEAEKHSLAMLASQCTDSAPLTGFFYRDSTKKAIVHFSHQARDHIFAMALCEAVTAMPESRFAGDWKASLSLFAGYLKALKAYTAPYGMLPAGIYHISEADDCDTISVVHPNVDPESERQNYIEQLENGISLGNGYYIRSFPVWFSFRGNSAIHLSMGKAASLIGRLFEDEELLDIAREQLYWTLGKNPFGQSLIYGEGKNYGRQYTALLGETVGEMPVGVQTRRNEDLPYWPPASIATYREVWTTPPGRWLWIVSDLI